MPGNKSGGSKPPSTSGGSKAGARKTRLGQVVKGAGKSAPAVAATPPPVQTVEQEATSKHHFPIVGVGASAGGLEAFTQLLENLPLDTGMGFVLVQHLAPRAHSMLPELLAKITRLPVTEVRNGMRVKPNHIYVTLPDITMSLENGVLYLRTRVEPRGLNRPIDLFLRSLAADQGSRAIGVILSGTASDGVLGLQAIKAEGGVTFAQEVSTAKYAGMPESAIATGCVDFILPPDQIARQLARLARHPFVNGVVLTKKVEVPTGEESEFNQILLLLKAATGVDFTHYKHSTIKRRILRRMMLEQVDRMADYVRRVREQPGEVKKLYEDILINVTSFFREPEAFEALRKIVFPELVRNRAPDEPIRIWIPGCASGEEPYSIAISLMEFLGDMVSNVQIQIFATDIEDLVIDKARTGIYPESVAEDLGPERLRRFFVKVPGGYQVSKAIRDVCVFARQNLIKDPPFSRLDLISCRNVLIYFGSVLQRKVIPIFHFALKPTGFLLLGKSESLSVYPDLFTLVDKKLKIYVRKSVAPHIPALAPDYPPLAAPGQAVTAPAGVVTPADLQREADHLVLARYGPAGLVIDENMTIIHFRGHTGPFLEPAQGEASLNLMKMAREGLQLELRAAVHTALKGNSPVRKEGLRLLLNNATRVVNLEVLPLRLAGAGGRYFLVTFEDATPAAKPEVPLPAFPGKKPPKGSTAKDRRITELTSELAVTKEYLQAVVEEQETAVEELKSSNEELMSANEELQSINEEMETSKEELQSTNEELATLNEELDNRNQELRQTHNDLQNLLNAVQIAIVILGADLRIRRFNPAAQEMLNLIPADLGRPISDIRLRVDVPDLESLIHEVLQHLVIKEQEVRDRDGRWYSLRLRPYRTADNKIDGAVLALVDVDALKRSLEEVQQARDFAQAIIATMREPLIVLDGTLRVISANEAFYRTFKGTPGETEGRLFYELGNRQWNITRLRELLENILPANQQFQDFEVQHDFPDLGHRAMLLNARRLARGSAAQDLILLALEDVTDRKQAERALRDSEAKLRDLARHLLTLQEQERRKLSWDLHEDLAQSIIALKMEFRSFEKKLPEGDAALREDYRQAVEKIGGIVEHLRRRGADLSPQILEDLGLNTSLKTLCDGFKIACTLEMDDLSHFFAMEDQVILYRIFEEALNNIKQHAQATQVTLTAKKQDGRVDFLVEDNGQGFDVGRVEDLEAGRRGIGLAAMSERAKSLGGAFKLESQLGVGTRIFFSIPRTRK